MTTSSLILIDGMPGSGKSTTGQLLADRMSSKGVPNRFYHELEDRHPLRIYDRTFTSFTIEEEAEWFAAKVKELFQAFVSERLLSQEVTIIESYLFQDTIGFAYNMGMKPNRILELTASLQEILAPLQPRLIYFSQPEPERHWRWICEVRGPEFAKERCGLHTEEDFVQAGIFWSRNQQFVSSIVDRWEIPKIVITNENRDWSAYMERIIAFLDL